MSDLEELVQERERALLRPWKGGTWFPPRLATLTDARFSDSDWLFERKLDGARVIAGDDGGGTELWSRNGKRTDAAYPEIADALGEQGVGRFVVDGEVVAFEGSQTSFARLQRRMHRTSRREARMAGVPVYFYVFDLLALGGVDLTRLPLRTRKRLLRTAFDFTDPLRLSPHRVGGGESFYRQACARGWEGLIAKRADSRYASGRSREWLKFKCVSDQEFVVGGFTDPRGSRAGFGALLVGYYDGTGLRYAGKVGTGFDTGTLGDLRRRLDALARDSSPFVDPVPESDVHWVSPEIVVQVGFAEWTSEGRLRHPRFTGVREDKVPEEVVRESGSPP
jgi:DNA ligase D-like protein (predicted ligase)